MRTKKFGLICLVFALLAAACSSQEAQEDTSRQEQDKVREESQKQLATAFENERIVFEEKRVCSFTVPTYFSSQCSELVVPADWDDPNNEEEITLSAVILTTENTPEEAVPVVYLEGGPGGDSLGTLQFIGKETWQYQLAEKHPLVLFSQRGANESSQELACNALNELTLEMLDQDITVEESNKLFLEELDGCIEKLEEDDIDFTAFSSQASANDIEALRQSLYDDEPWHVLGISYGTRLAQSVMRQHPDGIVSVLLDSVMPSDPTESVTDVAESVDKSLERLFATCAEDQACSKQFPDLENRFYAVLEAANKNPVTFTIDDFNGFVTVERDVLVNGEDIMGMVFQALYQDDAAAAIPQLVEDLEKGETRFLERSTSLLLQNQEFIYPIMNQSVLCRDVYAFLEKEDYEEGKSGNEKLDEFFVDDEEFETTQEVCEALGSGKTDRSDVQELQSDIPTLLYAGEYDPITPLSFAESVSESLSDSQVLSFPHTGHAALSQDCGALIALEFFSAPDNDVDTGCIDEIDPLYWLPAPVEENPAFESFDKGFLQGQIPGGHTLTGVAPADWDEVLPGYFLQDKTNVLAQANLLVLAHPRIEGSSVADLLPGLGLKDLTAAGVVESEGRTWQAAQAVTAQDQLALVYSMSEGSAAASVVLLVDPAEEEAMKSFVIPEVLAGVEITEGQLLGDF